jgi:transcriptional regulator with XRE-family HTH domain
MVQEKPTPLGIGARIRELRRVKKMSQGDIEERAGLLRCYISRVENGHTVPSLETLERFASALGIPIAMFFQHEGDPPLPSVFALPQAAAKAGQTPDEEGDRFFLRLRELMPRLNRRDQKVLLDLAKKMAEK